MNPKFINLHSHHCNDSNSICIQNCIAGKEGIPSSGYFSCGIHPWFLSNTSEQKNWMEKNSTHPFCLAIGECGLDKVCTSPIADQREIFEWQCELAKKLNLPMILHVVKAHFDVIEILKEFKITKAVFHGYNSRYTILEKILQEGFSVSAGSALLNSSSQINALFTQIPEKNLFFETDDSAVSIEEIYAKAADLKKIRLEDLQNIISINFNSLFKPIL